MQTQFYHSKIKEKEKLLNIYLEYQWFIDNNFSIILPKFYRKIYQQNENNKKLFAKNLSRELDKMYNENHYREKQEKIKNNWQKIESCFFKILKQLDLKIQEKYICYISLYGPQGQFQRPNIINLRAAKQNDIKEADTTIAHEILHLIIFHRVKKLKLDYKQTEGVIDLFFTDTKLKNIFPKYKLQNIAIHNKKMFYQIKNSLKL